MLQEAVEVIGLLHTGEEVSHHCTFYEVQEARIYTKPEKPVPIHLSGFGPQGARLAGRIGDGFCVVRRCPVNSRKPIPGQRISPM